MNPWNLTDRERDVLVFIGRLGTAKVAAKELGLSHRTVEIYLSRAREKMKVAHTILAVLMWDRYVSPRSAEHDSVE